CGKSTLLELLSGISLPDSGDIFYDSQMVTGKAGILGYMPQDDLLFPWLKTIDNILLPVRVQGKNIHIEREKAARLLPVFGLESYADHLPWQLSGGLRQRAALARTYMTGSKVLLLDEPLANLDAITRSGLQDWLGEVVHNLSLAIILVTHDIDEAIKLSDRIEVMKDGLFVASFQVDNRLDEHSQRILKEHIQNAL
ncbi:MAG: ATP-binding cassette domain-containing protein, partial [Candidatus Cloacimonetes bacterium]|nr:ATP-binding cassette domain-containing protein [Candidatus Cloacimonadota bacterium]MDD4099953.1 ATP-binding cassette domain-containing protein [Candidatus Cloacimonadota bacterium]MDD4806127.1 ATP-binding cassette domain-containing protein [Candidatus Cloacimonadota bacterium]